MEDEKVIHIIYVKVPSFTPGGSTPERVYCEDSYCEIEYVE